ncbi:hypothetical protein [Streptomyces sp. NPDC014733]|uniref:hypothetical protein n=1 Tax=Streptomyces sp. NPDC014733 TaxID=3364885 RepID=UPI00370323F7
MSLDLLDAFDLDVREVVAEETSFQGEADAQRTGWTSVETCSTLHTQVNCFRGC